MGTAPIDVHRHFVAHEKSMISCEIILIAHFMGMISLFMANAKTFSWHDSLLMKYQRLNYTHCSLMIIY